MSAKLYVVTVKNAEPKTRLISAEGVNAVTNYLLDIRIAKPQDVADLMANGVKLEKVEGGE